MREIMGVSLPSVATTTIKLSVILVAVVVVVEGATSTSTSTSISLGRNQWSLPGCPDKCGNVHIPYPFGIRERCYYNRTYDDDMYAVTCNKTDHPPKLEWHGIPVLQIGLSESKIRMSHFASDACYDKNGDQTRYTYPSLRTGLFTLSASQNVFVAIGCDTFAWLDGTRHNKPYSTGCMTMCNNREDIVNGTCSGIGCCQITIPDGVKATDIDARSIYNHTNVSSFNPCSSAFIIEKDAFNFSLANLTAVPPEPHLVPVVMNWMIVEENCSMAQVNGHCLCDGNTSKCDDSSTHGVGYRCKCLDGYSGNPYMKDGCRDVDECIVDQHNNCENPNYCVNTIGSYECKCPKGFHGSGTKSDHCVRSKVNGVVIVVGVFGGIITSILIAHWLYWRRKKNQLLKVRERFFRQNGGHLLHQKLSTCEEVSAEVVRIFTVEELEKATNKYSDENIIGKGGFGVVYKGVLENNQVVAIKKSLKVDPRQNEEFINEVIIVSQLNNRNVVKLLGCCLETQVPLLVYEFINNGTLYEHLRDEKKASRLTWNIRLKIASEVAEVLSYLHTTISIPIIHRDMKSTNILLDGNNYTAKVSDFGASRLLPIDKDQLATVVLGTYGYLDPEYLQTSQLTQKSDVYSFGVVLVELLTRLKALSYDRPEQDRNLAIFFLRKLNEEHRLIEILDDIILTDDDGAIEQAVDVANLAQRCLKLEGKERPTMKEVAIELQRIKGMSSSHPWETSSGEVLKEKNTVLLGGTGTPQVECNVECNDLNHSTGNIMASFNSQVISLLASTLGCGR